MRDVAYQTATPPLSWEVQCCHRQHVLRAEIHGYTGCKRMGFVKPDSVKLAKGHLLHDEAGPWNRALQTTVPPWIQGLVRRVPGGAWLFTLSLPLQSPLHLTQFAVPFVQIVATVCLQGTWFYTIFYDMCNAWYMVLGPWVAVIRCSLNQSEHLPTPPVWLRKVSLLSSQSETWVDATCSFKIEHPGCTENQALANHPCSVEHILLHALVKYTIQLALQSMFSYTRYNRVVWALEAPADQ